MECVGAHNAVHNSLTSDLCRVSAAHTHEESGRKDKKRSDERTKRRKDEKSKKRLHSATAEFTDRQSAADELRIRDRGAFKPVE